MVKINGDIAIVSADKRFWKAVSGLKRGQSVLLIFSYGLRRLGRVEELRPDSVVFKFDGRTRGWHHEDSTVFPLIIIGNSKDLKKLLVPLN